MAHSSLVSSLRRNPRCGDGEFSVASARNLIDDRTPGVVGSKTRWIEYVPIKVNILVWRIKLNNHPSRLNLSRRGLDLDTISCRSCNSAVESTNHILFGCSMAKDLYKYIARWWDVSMMTFSSYDEWWNWFSNLRVPSKLKMIFEGVFYISWWVIWNYQNKVIFGPGYQAKDRLLDDIVALSFTWCKSRCKAKFSRPIPPVLLAYSAAQVLVQCNAVYDAHNEVACLMLGSMTPELHRQFENFPTYEMLYELKSMFEKQAGMERVDLIQTFHACKQEEGKPVGSVGQILNGLTSDFSGFVWNYNMHNMRKKTGELHALLIKYEKGLPKKAATTKKPFPHRTGRATDLLRLIHTDVCNPLRHVSRQESATRIFSMVPAKKVDKTPYELWLKKAQEKDKIGSKPDKNGKRGEAKKILKQLQ
nr:RNA-directed DNA polymerase, eukaryota [Tanacetum cinerariifolium]